MGSQKFNLAVVDGVLVLAMNADVAEAIVECLDEFEDGELEHFMGVLKDRMAGEVAHFRQNRANQPTQSKPKNHGHQRNGQQRNNGDYVRRGPNHIERRR